ncbi:MAG: superoxide dismutase [Mycoplasmatales bacterium]
MEKLLDLKYDLAALEPIIDKETVDIHHNMHHNAYVTNFNGLIEGTNIQDKDITSILKDLSCIPQDIKQGVINNGGGVWNHNFYFEQLKPGGKELSNQELIDLINSTFGSFEELKNQLVDGGMKRFGSGWIWLVLNNDRVEIVNTLNQDCPISEGLVPLLTIDVWEHAYYLKYQNRRKEYLESIFDIIDFEVVEQRFLNK